MMPTYTGAADYTEKEKFQKVAFGDIEKGKIPYPKNSNDGWIGILQHYFLGAWLPKNGGPREFYTRQLQQGLYAAGVIVPVGVGSAQPALDEFSHLVPPRFPNQMLVVPRLLHRQRLSSMPPWRYLSTSTPTRMSST